MLTLQELTVISAVWKGHGRGLTATVAAMTLGDPRFDYRVALTVYDNLWALKLIDAEGVTTKGRVEIRSSLARLRSAMDTWTVQMITC